MIDTKDTPRYKVFEFSDMLKKWGIKEKAVIKYVFIYINLGRTLTTDGNSRLVDTMSDEDMASMVNPARANPWKFSASGKFIVHKDSGKHVIFISFGLSCTSNVVRPSEHGREWFSTICHVDR